MEPDPKLNQEITPIEPTNPIDKFKPNEQIDQKDTMYQDKQKKTNSGSKKPFIIILVILIVLSLMVIAASASYLWRDKTATDAEAKQADEITALQKEIASLSKQKNKVNLKDDVAVVTEPTTCTVKAPTATVIESIRASITSGNTAALAGYMAPSVNVILAATEGVGPSTPAVAVSSITSFIKDATSPWDFALAASVLSKYSASGYKQYFPAIAEVGKSANGKVISFSFDCDGKISTVFMAGSAEML